MKQIITIIAGFLLFVACSHDDQEDTDDHVDRAVLVYMAGDNDLSSYIYQNIKDMMAGSRELDKHQKLVLFVDKRGQRPYLLEVAKGDTTRLQTFGSDLKSSDASVLQMVMEQVVQRYPCNSYGLVLWGHANGWIYKDNEQAAQARRAYGQTLSGGETWMNIPDMARALAAVPKLEFIFADCCDFQSVESAYELRDVTNYIIASPAEIPGEGAPYATLVPTMFSKSETFYQQMADAYYAQVVKNKRVPLSVIRTSAMETLAAATKKALASFVPSLPDSRYPDVNGLIYYLNKTKIEPYGLVPCYLIDMNDFMLRYAAPDEYKTWKQVFDEAEHAAVAYKKYTCPWIANFVSFSDFTATEERYGGVSMYVPMDASKYSSDIRDVIAIQNKNIHKMAWYQAAGLADLGW